MSVIIRDQLLLNLLRYTQKRSLNCRSFVSRSSVYNFIRKSTENEETVGPPGNSSKKTLGSVIGFSNYKFRKRSHNKENITDETKIYERDCSNTPSVEDLPVFLRVKHRSFPQETENEYPTVAKFLNESISARELTPADTSTAIVQFPYKIENSIAIESGKPTDIVTSTNNVHQPMLAELTSRRRKLIETIANWISFLEENNVDDMKNVDGIQPDVSELQEGAWRLDYGSPDPAIPPSKTTCGGCGSVIHCQDTTIPGYIPSEKFTLLSEFDLKNTLCQRCTFLKEHNVALSVNVSKEYYTDILSKIKYKTALVLLLVDLTDFPCSVWPGIVDVIGKKCPVIVVGTKVDLLPRDEDEYLSRIKQALVQNLQDIGVHRGENVLDVHLISAKTFYGVENLINKIFHLWSKKGDIFLVGCTNVGKSTLFNALLQSDLCNIRTVDLIQRATTSVWPGTTLNLLKFPIHKMSGLRLSHRNRRLADLSKVLKQERLLRESMYRVTKDPKYATLMGRIGVTTGGSKSISEGRNIPTFYNPDDRRFADSHFCFDTPGAIYKDQILDLLTIEELVKTLPKEMIVPRTFTLRGQQTLFLAGLARIDVLQVQNLMDIYLTVFSSPQLPVYIVATEDADRFYSENLGTVLEVPSGSAERLSHFPKLIPHQFQCTGTRFDESCIDIVLSSAGWASVTARRDQRCKLLAYTPEGRGLYLRQPALLPYAVRLKGKKFRYTPVFQNEKCSIISNKYI